MSPPAIAEQKSANQQKIQEVCFKLDGRDYEESIDYKKLCDNVGGDNDLIKQINQQSQQACINVCIGSCGSAACQIKEFDIFIDLIKEGHFTTKQRRPTPHMLVALQKLMAEYKLAKLEKYLSENKM